MYGPKCHAPLSHDKHVNENMSNMSRHANIPCHVVMSPPTCLQARGTLFGLFGVFDPDFDKTDMSHGWGRECGHGHTGAEILVFDMTHTWENVDTHKGQSLT